MSSEDNSLRNSRYESLIAIWMHHNTAQLAVPPVVVGTSLLAMSVVAAGVPDSIDPLLKSNWGATPVNYVAIPLWLTGLVMAAMHYTMGRARTIMLSIEAQLSSWERESGLRPTFREFNRPNGVSGTLLLRCSTATLIVFPVTAAGFLLSFGERFGILLSVLFAMVWLTLEYRSRSSIARQELRTLPRSSVETASASPRRPPN